MKYTNNFECPHCGSPYAEWIHGFVFKCRFCENEFNLEIEKLNNESKQKLRDYLTQLIRELYAEKIKPAAKLRTLIKRRDKTAIEVVGWVLLFTFIVFGISFFTIWPPLVFILPLIGIVCFIVSRIIRNKANKKYTSEISEVAKIVSEIDEKIKSATYITTLIEN